MSAPAGRPDRILIVILSVIAGLVVLALAAVFFSGRPEPLAEDTPAGVVQRYAAAVLDGDEAGAARYLTESSERQCGAGRPHCNRQPQGDAAIDHGTP